MSRSTHFPAFTPTSGSLVRERAARVSTFIKIDDRVGATGRLEGKTDALEARLGRKLKR